MSAPAPIINKLVIALTNSPLHRLVGSSIAVIYVTGRKTGKVYATPINVTRDGDCYTVTSQRERTWWRNLRGGKPATLQVMGQRLTVTGEVIEALDSVYACLNDHFRRYPQNARFYHVRRGPDQQPLEADVRRASQKLVFITLRVAGDR